MPELNFRTFLFVILFYFFIIVFMITNNYNLKKIDRIPMDIIYLLYNKIKIDFSQSTYPVLVTDNESGMSTWAVERTQIPQD